MKRTALVFSIILLCGTVSIAQNIGKNTFEAWVDYENCKCTATYIELFRHDVKEKESIANYDKNVKEKLSNCTPENPVSFTEFSDLLQKNGWKETYSKISAKINEKKQKFHGNEMDVVSAIALLKLDDGIDVKITEKLQPTVNTLQQELNSKYVQQLPPKENKPISVVIPPPIPPVQESSNTGLWIALIVTWVALIVLVTFFSKKHIECVITKRQRHMNTYSNSEINSDVLVDIDIKKIIYELLQNEEFINSIVDRVQECLELNDKERTSNVPTNKEADKKPFSKYLKGKSRNVFSIVSETSDGCFFKLINEKSNTAEFEYCGTIDDARSQFNSIFDNVCSTEGSAQNAKNVKTTQNGKVKFIDSKWEVTEKAKIKFE